MKFKGHDYCELATAWGIPLREEFDDENIVLDDLRDYIWDAFDDKTQKLDEDVLVDMVNFLSELECSANELTYSGPLWSGLLMIEDDFTFVKYFCLLLPEMRT